MTSDKPPDRNTLRWANKYIEASVMILYLFLNSSVLFLQLHQVDIIIPVCVKPFPPVRFRHSPKPRVRWKEICLRPFPPFLLSIDTFSAGHIETEHIDYHRPSPAVSHDEFSSSLARLAYVRDVGRRHRVTHAHLRCNGYWAIGLLFYTHLYFATL